MSLLTVGRQIIVIVGEVVAELLRGLILSQLVKQIIIHSLHNTRNIFLHLSISLNLMMPHISSAKISMKGN